MGPTKRSMRIKGTPCSEVGKVIICMVGWIWSMQRIWTCYWASLVKDMSKREDHLFFNSKISYSQSVSIFFSKTVPKIPWRKTHHTHDWRDRIRENSNQLIPLVAWDPTMDTRETASGGTLRKKFTASNPRPLSPSLRHREKGKRNFKSPKQNPNNN